MSNFETFTPLFGGIPGTAPRFYSASTTDSIAALLTTGYLNDLSHKVKADDIVYVKHDDGTENAGAVEGRVVVSGSDYSFVMGTTNGQWIDVPAYSAKWTSQAQVAYVNGMIFMRGTFTSTANDNEDLIGHFPPGYKGSFSVSVPIIRAGLPIAADLGTGGDYFGTSVVAQTGDVVHTNISYFQVPD